MRGAFTYALMVNGDSERFGDVSTKYWRDLKYIECRW